jgi:hypothetical protein
MKLCTKFWSSFLIITSAIFLIITTPLRSNNFKEKVKISLTNKTGLEKIDIKFDDFVYHFAVCGYFRDHDRTNIGGWERFLYVDDHSHTIDGVNFVPDQPLLIVGNVKIQSSSERKYCSR